MSTDRSRAASAASPAARAAVAAGNADTAAAAATVLESGGNAFDAAVAAGFAAAVSEPGLSSLGGGGFLLAHRATSGHATSVSGTPGDAGAPGEPDEPDERGEPNAPIFFDFFVDAPGRELAGVARESEFTPVTVRFTGADQVFHAGWASAAVPGCLDGYLHVHERLGRLPLAQVVAPARALAERGSVLDATQAYVVTLLEAILTLTPEGRAIFAPRGRLLRAGDRMRNPDLAGVLDEVASGSVAGFADPRLAGPLTSATGASGGRITGADLASYRVVERLPAESRFRDARIWTNPPPSYGGSLVLSGLAELDREPRLDGSEEGYSRLARTLVGYADRHILGPHVSRGTTHVSVVDAEGNIAAMTTSNGSCSGVFVPGTGIQLNNIMGEADLHPGGFSSAMPGIRIGSMMAPTLVAHDGSLVALGSGGSERIRSALTCLIVGLVDRGFPLAQAIDHPRLHWDRSTLQVEPGLPAPVVAELARRWPVSEWSRPDLFFGGVNAVSRGPRGDVTAAGDARRGGVGLVVDVMAGR